MDMMPPGQPGQPPADPMAGEMPGTPGDVELCIKIAADGSMSVYQESGEQDGESAAQPAADIGQALKLVLDLYKRLQTAQGNPEEQFDRGFGAAQPQARMGGNMGGMR